MLCIAARLTPGPSFLCPLRRAVCPIRGPMSLSGAQSINKNVLHGSSNRHITGHSVRRSEAVSGCTMTDKHRRGEYEGWLYASSQNGGPRPLGCSLRPPQGPVPAVLSACVQPTLVLSTPVL